MKLIRPNGEELEVPFVDLKQVAKDFNYSNSRGKMKFDGEKFIPYEEEVRPQTHSIVTDEMEPTRCMACRRYHTSKSAMRRCYRERGFIEVGNNIEGLEIKPDPKEEEAYLRQVEEDVAKAVNDLKWNAAPVDELTRERCKILDRQIKDSGDGRLRSWDGSTLLDGRDGD